MAKKSVKTETESHVSESTATNDTVVTGATVLKYQDFETPIHALGVPHDAEIPKALAYLIMNGFNQSMTDAAAFTKDQKEKALEEALKTDPEATAEDVNAKMAHEARAKRFEAIISGTVGFRAGGGARLPQIDKLIRDIAHEQIKAAVVAKGVAMPKGDKLKAFIDARVAKAGEALRAEAQSRLDAAKGAAADLDDLFAE